MVVAKPQILCFINPFCVDGSTPILASLYIVAETTRFCAKPKRHWSTTLFYSGYVVHLILCNLLWSPNLLMMWLTKKFCFHLTTAHDASCSSKHTCQMLHSVRHSEEGPISCNLFKQLVVMKLTFNSWFWNTMTTTKLVLNSKTEVSGPSFTFYLSVWSRHGSRSNQICFFYSKNFFIYFALNVLFVWQPMYILLYISIT